MDFEFTPWEATGRVNETECNQAMLTQSLYVYRYLCLYVWINVSARLRIVKKKKRNGRRPNE